jgi:7-cyano-7-deazaguanine synthase
MAPVADNKKAVVLLSGGLDSSTSLAVARAEGYELYALSFDYLQRHRIELESARKVAASLGAKKHLVVRIDLREIGGSALTSDIEVPKGRDELSVTSDELKEEDPSRITDRASSVIPVTYVPARNTIFLSFALAWAEVLGAGDIFIGANAIDYSGYPDCRPEYLKAFEQMANLATKVSVEGRLYFRIRAPLVTLKKSEIILTGAALGLDYSLTWSCYDPQVRQVQGSEEKLGTRNPELETVFVPCGSCDSCRIRARGFAEAGLKDPLVSSGDFKE